MAVPHDWTECRPAVLSLEGAPPVSAEAIELAWSLVPEQDRLLFHQFCCLNRRDTQTLEAIDRIADLMKIATGPGVRVQPGRDAGFT